MPRPRSRGPVSRPKSENLLRRGHVGAGTRHDRPVGRLHGPAAAGALREERLGEVPPAREGRAEFAVRLLERGAQGEHAHPAILVGLLDDLPVVSIDKEIRVLDTGRLAVPKLPEALREEPTLELLVASDRDEQNVEIAYPSHKVDAEMAYQLVRSPGSDFAELVGLVGVSNDTGTPLVDASVTLSTDTGEPLEFGSTDTVARAGTTQVRLASPISLGAGQRATVRLFGPTPVTLARKVVVEGSGLPSYSTTPEEVSNGSIRAVLDAAAKDGEPLSPRGLVAGQAHLSERAAGEPPRAYGAAMARPLPRAKGMRIDLGDERKYPARRRLVARRDLGRCVVESAWEVTLSNPTENPVPIEDVEPVSGKYEVLDSSTPVLATEPDNFAFALTVPPHGEAKLKFRVKTTTCVVKRRGYWQSWGSKKGSAWKEGK